MNKYNAYIFKLSQTVFINKSKLNTIKNNQIYHLRFVDFLIQLFWINKINAIHDEAAFNINVCNCNSYQLTTINCFLIYDVYIATIYLFYYVIYTDTGSWFMTSFIPKEHDLAQSHLYQNKVEKVAQWYLVRKVRLL